MSTLAALKEKYPVYPFGYCIRHILGTENNNLAY